MNYRHSYHAGSHSDVFKHAALCLLIESLQRKEKAMFMLDSHAGTGCYDLQSAESQKTKEYAGGIGAVLSSDAPTLAPYLRLIRDMNPHGLEKYPGSPLLMARFMRPQDRAAVCELHPDDFGRLKSLLAAERSVAVHHRDGYEAMLAFIPPKERRGLIFVDPPFEKSDETKMLASRLAAACAKWPTGTFAAWYPVKDIGAGRLLKDVLRERFAEKTLAATFLRYPVDGATLAGSGLIVVNVPWKFDQTLRQLCSELAHAFGDAERCRWSVEWLAASR